MTWRKVEGGGREMVRGERKRERKREGGMYDKRETERERELGETGNRDKGCKGERERELLSERASERDGYTGTCWLKKCRCETLGNKK